MRIVLLTAGLFAFAVCGEVAHAKDRAVAQAEAFAAKLLPVLEGGDDAALENTMKTMAPADPWFVADVLIRDGHAEVAATWAGRVQPPSMAGLAAYIEKARTWKEPDPARAALAAMFAAARKGDWAAALNAGLALGEDVESVTGLNVLSRTASLHQRAKAFDEALRLFRLAATKKETIGWRSAAAFDGYRAGVIALKRDKLADAAALFEKEVSLWSALGNQRAAASAKQRLASTYGRLGQPEKAVAAVQEAIEVFEALKRTDDLAGAVITLGATHQRKGDMARAVLAYERAARLYRELGNAKHEAVASENAGSAYLILGEVRRALDQLLRARTLFRQLGDQRNYASSTANLSAAEWILGNNKRSIALAEEARKLAREAGDKDVELTALSSIAKNKRSLGAYDEALPLVEALVAALRQGNRLKLVRALVDLALTKLELDKPAEATVHAAEAITLAEAAGARSDLASALRAMGRIHAHEQRYDEAVRMLERSLRIDRALRKPGGFVVTSGVLAEVRMKQAKHERALATANAALPELERLFGRLSETGGARLRGTYQTLFRTGFRAALASGHSEEALQFLESGRAGSLLEMLSAADALRGVAVPAELLEREKAAWTRVRTATKAYAARLEKPNLMELRKAVKAIDRARGALRAVRREMQRHAKQAANLFYPRPATLDDVQAELVRGDVLVLYALFRDDAYAMVITKGDVRVVELGLTEAIRAAAEALALHDLEATEEAARASLRAIGDRVWAPLALPAETKRILVSPDDVLSAVPFPLLSGNVPCCVVPSATVWTVLREQKARVGKGVLAVGNPAYGPVPVRVGGAGGRLASLPATEAEARAIGSVVRTGEAATAAAVLRVLTEVPRWRAVHFACHGLVDVHHPLESALALTPTDERPDGLLTAYDIFRADVRADLVTLSACQTGRGAVARAEGVMGTTRAFLIAGAPRVICSLWNVDDAATSALMTKFYELWAPKEGTGLPAIQALGQAQAFIRGQERWRHPYYWGAWVLWGLPD